MKIRVLFLIGFVFVMFQSCTKDVIEPTIVPVNTSVKFSTDVYPIFANHGCTACHGASSPSAGLTLAATASTVRTNLITVGAVVASNSASSKLYSKFANGATHSGLSLSAVEVGNIKSWIDLGALAN